jgi:uncharacterized protein YdiU (UPF0061 family)
MDNHVTIPTDYENWPQHLKDSYDKLCAECDDRAQNQLDEFLNIVRGANKCSFLNYVGTKIGVNALHELDTLEISVELLCFLIEKMDVDSYRNINIVSQQWILDKLNIPIRQYERRITEITNTIDVLAKEKADVTKKLNKLNGVSQSVQENTHPLERKLLTRNYEIPLKIK